MLFTFPQEALNCNWVNQTAVDTLIAGMDAIDDENAPLDWPDCLPQDRRNVLQRRTGLRPKLTVFWDEYAKLGSFEKRCLRDAVAEQINLPNVYSDVSLPCACLDDIPVAMQDSVKSLAEYLFSQLGGIKEGGKVLRDIQFETCQNHGIRICPFCGLEHFQPEGTKRNALDHLMPISKYPFVSADFKNLIPTCHTCNSLYKLDQDILFNDAGVRRPCSDPYDGPIYQIKLDESVFDEGNEVRGFTLPKWEISISGLPAEQSVTWDDVYQVKSRFASVLDADFLSWVKSFALWFVSEFGRGKSPDEISVELPRYTDNVIQSGYSEVRVFLKAEVFRFLERSCRDVETGDDVKQWLWSQIEYAV